MYVVMERGDVDLSTVLKNRRKANSTIDENSIRLYWQQMLEAVHTVHQAHVVHADLKPANFLVVEGTLKLIDFGISTQVQEDQTSVRRYRTFGRVSAGSSQLPLGHPRHGCWHSQLYGTRGARMIPPG